MSNQQHPKPRLGYRYEFTPNELEAAQACVELHGFAVIKQLITPSMVAELCASVLNVVIEDSHVDDWQPSEGFALLPGKGSFHRVGTEPKGYTGFDVPGLAPLYSEPGDEIVFAARTYHAAFPNNTNRVRLSCGMSLRPRSTRLDAPWPLSETARAFVEAQPEAVRPMLENYIGIDPGWRSNTQRRS